MDITCPDGGDRHARVVDPEGHHVETGFGVRPPIVVQDDGLRGPQAEDVGPEGPRARSDRGDGAIDARDDVPGVREEGLAVECQLAPTLTGPLAAITLSGALLLATPLLLPGRRDLSAPEPAAPAGGARAA